MKEAVDSDPERHTTAKDMAVGIELVVGLGNPGDAYARTRHNVGFRVLDQLVRNAGAERWVPFSLCHATSAPQVPRLILAKPRTFMNRSGEAVEWLLDHLEMEPDQMLVVVDDVDLDLGALRIRPSGGPGTHNGLRDICDRLGDGFPRLRLGVRGDEGWEDLASWVLSPFSNDEVPVAETMLRRAADAAATAVEDGVVPAMSRFNGPPPPEPGARG